jgi:endonuclease YncB( thermonuclease family)
VAVLARVSAIASVALGMFALVVPVASASTTTASVVEVLDPSTLTVQLESGTTEQVRLIGLDAAQNGCRIDQAIARTQELVSGERLTVELDETSADQANVWLADGRNLAEVLLREGYVRRTSGEPGDTRSAAQAAAVADRVGIWAPGACRGSISPGNTDGAVLGVFVTSSADVVQRASIGVNVLREQALSAPLLIATPGWRQTTTMALGWIRVGSDEMRTASGAAPPARPLADELVQLGDRLQAEAEAYSSGASAADLGQVQAAASRLGQTATVLGIAAAELDALTSAYGVGD